MFEVWLINFLLSESIVDELLAFVHKNLVGNIYSLEFISSLRISIGMVYFRESSEPISDLLRGSTDWHFKIVIIVSIKNCVEDPHQHPYYD